MDRVEGISRSFQKRYFEAPIGPGVYELRNKKTGEYVLFGETQYVACRMSSLLPKESGGSDTRNNKEKRKYVWENINNIEYMTLACGNEEEAKEEEGKLDKEKYRYKT